MSHCLCAGKRRSDQCEKHGRESCTHAEAFNLPCGPQFCPDCDAEVTVGCDGDEGRCKICASDLRSGYGFNVKKENSGE